MSSFCKAALYSNEVKTWELLASFGTESSVHGVRVILEISLNRKQF